MQWRETECLTKDCTNDIKELGTDGDVHEIEGGLRRKDKRDGHSTKKVPKKSAPAVAGHSLYCHKRAAEAPASAAEAALPPAESLTPEPSPRLFCPCTPLLGCATLCAELHSAVLPGDEEGISQGDTALNTRGHAVRNAGIMGRRVHGSHAQEEGG